MGVLPKVDDLGLYEITMHSIGGLGANVAGKILTEAGILGMGLNGASFASYGSEKKGTPISAFVRFAEADTDILVNAPIATPHMLVIFHEALIPTRAMSAGLREDAVVIVNTNKKDPDEVRDSLKLAAGTLILIDATAIALETKSRPNTILTGTITALSGFLDVEKVKEAVLSKLGKYKDLIESNMAAFERGQKEFIRKDYSLDGKYPLVPATRFYSNLGYETQKIGGVIPSVGNMRKKSNRASRQGEIPVWIKEKCVHCGECDVACPDMAIIWRKGVDDKGKEGMLMTGVDYQYCKGCLKCVAVCKFEALKHGIEPEYDTVANSVHRYEN